MMNTGIKVIVFLCEVALLDVVVVGIAGIAGLAVYGWLTLMESI